MGVTDCDCAADDVVMWINGGPGCSTAMGLLMELRPVQLDMKNASTNGTVGNPHSWDSEANIYLDRSSYAHFGETVETTEDASKNIYTFISLFFESFEHFKGSALHLSGESYENRAATSPYSRVTSTTQNQLPTAAGRRTPNLQSVLIRNGITDISILYPGRYDAECGVGALKVPEHKHLGPDEGYCNPPSPEHLRHLQRPHQPLLQHAVPALTELPGVDPHQGNFSACTSDVGRLFNARPAGQAGRPDAIPTDCGSFPYVPYGKPEEALVLLSAWLHGRQL
ncbi:Peptidase S10, serine carboxypeptidase [Mycena sanguinolenta]|uniref:carboxypeptidase C n=1 Tax=Mycena sanguinolenta TaxID=230812 RepID=A0A8H7DBZ6_9AGAR|nr:Peptidase S10, serine carboxypeptidase [Mycena sanguinolenta]